MRHLVPAILVLVVLVAVPAVAEGPSEGEELFLAQKCNLCHAVPPADIEAKTRSDKLRGSDLGLEPLPPFEEVAAYLRGETEIDGEKHKKKVTADDAELKKIVDWLNELAESQG